MTKETELIETMTEVELHVKYQSYAQAIALLNSLIAKYPNYLPAKESLMEIYRKKGQLEKANETARQIALIRDQIAQQRLEKDPGVNAQLERRQLNEQIDKIIKEVYETNDLNGIQRITASTLVEALDADRCVIVTLGERTGQASGYEYCRKGIPPSLDSRTGRLNGMCLKRAAVTLEPLVIEEPMKDPDLVDCRSILQEFNIQSILAFPMVYKSKLIGIILLHRCTGPIRWSDQGKNLFTIVVGHVAVAINNARQFSAVQTQAITDKLTGVYNRRFFEDRFSVELRNAQHQRYPVCLVLLDIDHFKRINDTYGHAAGDKVLHKLGFLLKTNLRKGSVVARFGGEEFAIILPNTVLHTAHFVMENIRKLVEGTIAVEDGSPITISIGVFEADLTDSRNLDEVQKAVIQGADQNLYQAKRSGRNQVRSGLEANQVQPS